MGGAHGSRPAGSPVPVRIRRFLSGPGRSVSVDLGLIHGEENFQPKLQRDYEILYIVRPDVEETDLPDVTKRVETLIESLEGNIQNTNVWGKRRLAYEVDHLKEGHYVLTDFQIEPARVPEMEATLKISDTVFRHLIVRKPVLKPGAATTESAAAAPAPLEAEAEAEVAGSDEPEPTTAAASDAMAPVTAGAEEEVEE
jgi:small subunit ribosomal protein S6